MKQGIHPEYVECTVKCSCGNTFTTMSTKPELKIDICNVCHPFYTGQQRFVDTGGRVQRFADKFGSAKETVATVAEALSKNLDLKAGDKAFVMINGCGATTMMEMLVLFKDTVEFLKAKGVEVVASMVGEILTVQEAGGFQMNIAKWDDEFIRLWNTPCHTPAYSKE